MDLFLVASTPFLGFSIHTCILSLLKTSSVLLLPLLPGWEIRAGIRAMWFAIQRNPLPSPPKSGLLSFVNFSSC